MIDTDPPREPSQPFPHGAAGDRSGCATLFLWLLPTPATALLFLITGGNFILGAILLLALLVFLGMAWQGNITDMLLYVFLQIIMIPCILGAIVWGACMFAR